MAKVILLSQAALPYRGIGSWTTLYRNYLERHHRIDFIICPKPDRYFDGVRYSEVRPAKVMDQLAERFFGRRFIPYLQALEKLIGQEGRFVIQIVDNLGMAKALQEFLNRKGLRDRCYLQYFYHGFPPFAPTGSNARMLAGLDEIVVLTQSSYEAFKDHTPILPPRFSILHNGIDVCKFFPVDAARKRELRAVHGIQAKNVFLWCSQDRPKKGLHVVLDAWRSVYDPSRDMQLIVVGTVDRAAEPGVQFHAPVPNDQLPAFYQMADVYLFSTLCLEGFGMSLIEAMHCGCHCVASRLGGVPEVLEYGKLGALVENPHFPEQWARAIDVYLQGRAAAYPHPGDRYTAQRWCDGMDAIIESAQQNFS